MFKVIRNFEYGNKLEDWPFTKLPEAKNKFNQLLLDKGENLTVDLQRDGKSIAFFEWDQENQSVYVRGFAKNKISMPKWQNKKNYRLVVEDEE